MAYQKPMALIYQELSQIPTEVVEPLRACIVGPNYDLIRYSESTEKANGYLGVYNPFVDTAYTWPNRPAGGIVDQDYARVFVDDALLQYFQDQAGGGLSTIQAVSGYSNRIRAANIIWKTYSTWARTATLFDRDVTVGDVVKVEAVVGGTTYSLCTTVTGFVNEVIASVIGAATALAANQGNTASICTIIQTAGADNPIDATIACGNYDGHPSGRVSETYTLTVIQASVGSDPTTATLSYVSGDGNGNGTLTPSAWGVATTVGTRGLTVTWSLDPSSSSAGAGIDADDFNDGQVWLATVIQTYVGVGATSGGTYTGLSDTTYIVSVTRGALWTAALPPQISVTTSTGIDMGGPYNVTGVGVPISIGAFGVTITFTGGLSTGLCFGDRWTIAATAASAGAIQTLVLANDLPVLLQVPTSSSSSSPGVIGDGPDLSVTLFITKDLELTENRTESPPNVNWSTSATQITLESGATAFDSTWTNAGVLMAMPLSNACSGYNSLYIQARYLLSANCEEVTTIATASAVTAALGPLSSDNPLALAVYYALLNSNGTAVRYVAICTDDLTGYLGALDVLTNRQDVWGLTPLSYLTTVHDAFKAHVLAMSTPASGRWRVTFIANELDLTTAMLTADSSGDPVLATVEEDPATPGYFIILKSAGADFITNDVSAGDTVRYEYISDGFGGSTYTEYVIDAVTNEDQIKLLTGPSAAEPVAKKFEVHHTNTPSELATQVATDSGRMASRRVINVFPDEPGNAGTTYEGYILAAAIAGLKSGVVPQQGLTNLNITGFDEMDRVTEFFLEAELDTMADAGTLIVTQSQVSPFDIYIRHQLTTDRTGLNTQEISITAIMDAASYVHLRRQEPYIGVTNITPRTLETIRTEIEATNEYLSGPTLETPLTGTMILSGTIVELYQMTDLLDHVYSEVELELPYPYNNLTLKLQA